MPVNNQLASGITDASVAGSDTSIKLDCLSTTQHIEANTGFPSNRTKQPSCKSYRDKSDEELSLNCRLALDVGKVANSAELGSSYIPIFVTDAS